MRGIGLVLLIIIMVVGCNGAPSPHNSGYIDLYLKDMPTVDLLAQSGEPDSCEFIALETREECLIDMIDEVVVTDSIILVHGPFEMVLHIFDRKGKYINTISGGRGAGEPETLRVWYVDTTNNRISNLDLYSGSWMHYTFAGEHIETIPIDDSLRKILSPEYIADIAPIDDEHFLAVYSDGSTIDHKFNILSRKDMSVVDGFVKQRHWEGFDFQCSSVSIVGVGEFMSFAPMYDTIYSLNADYKVRPKYVVHGERKPITSQVIDVVNNMSPADRLFYIFNQNYSIGIGMAYATKNYICMYINGLNQRCYRIIGNLATNSFSKLLLPESDEDIQSYNTQWFRGSTDDGFIGFVSPVNLIKDKDKSFVQNHLQLREICMNLKEDDNPIIGIYYVKE